MKVTCSTEKLKNAVTLADRMTGKNLTLPILHSILITVSGTTVKIRATNLAVGIEIEIPAKVEVEGMVVVKGDILANICNNLSGSTEVVLTLDHDNRLSDVKIRNLRYSYLITTPRFAGVRRRFAVWTGV